MVAIFLLLLLIPVTSCDPKVKAKVYCQTGIVPAKQHNCSKSEAVPIDMA